MTCCSPATSWLAERGMAAWKAGWERRMRYARCSGGALERPRMRACAEEASVSLTMRAHGKSAGKMRKLRMAPSDSVPVMGTSSQRPVR